MRRMVDQPSSGTANGPGMRPDVLQFPALVPAEPQAGSAAPSSAAPPAIAEQELDALHARLFEVLCEFASHYISRDDAEDVVQTAFYVLWDRHLRHEGRRPEAIYDALLFSMVRFRVLDFRRGRRRMLAYLSAYAQELTSWTRRWMQADSRVADDRFARAIKAARAEMSPRARELHIMSFNMELKVTEIVALTGAARGTVSSLLTKANGILRKHIERAGFSPAERRSLTAGRKS